MHPTRLILGSVVAIALTGLPAVSTAATTSDTRSPRPDPGITVQHLGDDGAQLLPGVRHGKDALRGLDAVGRARVAAVNRTTVSHLTALLSHDDTVRLGTDGRIFYADNVDAPAATQPTTTHEVRAAQWSTYPLANALTLHSDPGSAHTIYLDFDGYSIPSSDWWSDNAGLTANHSYGGFSLDATTTGAFSTAEEQYIQDVWRIVAEKYSAMDVDVTTQDPGVDAYTKESAGDTTYGTHVVITNDMTARPSGCTATSAGGCLGVGLVGVFNANEQGAPTTDYLEPAWVFTKFTAADDVLPAALVANDAAHEIGHTAGLDHDRTSGQDYYPGHDDWFPIMGASDLAIGQFNDGGYPGYVSDQTDPDGVTADDDDYKVMNLNGLPTRADDVSGTDALGSAASYAQSGVIETAADIDTYQVNRTCTNALTATATGIGQGQSVDLKVTIRDPNGIVQASDDPAAGHLTPQTWPDTPTGMDASAQVASAGTGLWTIAVEGVGLAGSTGYSDYGSVGQYNLTITGCSGSGGVAPDAPTGGSVSLTARSTTATIHWVAPVNHGDSAITGYAISGTPTAVPNAAANATSATLTDLVPGTTYQVKVAATNSTGGNGADLSIPVRVQTWMPTSAPTMTIKVSKNNVDFSYFEPSNPGNATFTTWRLTIGSQHFDDDYNLYVGSLITAPSNATYTAKLQLLGTADLGTTTPTYTKNFVVGATAPRIGLPISGKKGKPVTVGIRWALPSSLGGYPITGWKAIAYKLTKSGALGRGYITGMLSPRARSFNGRLPAGKYKFRVVAYNALGQSPPSAYSRVGVAR